MYKLETKKLSFEDYEILRLAGFDFETVLTFEDEEEIRNMSEVIGYHKAAKIVNAYGWAEAQALSNEYGIDEPLANIESVASLIILRLIEEHITRG